MRTRGGRRRARPGHRAPDPKGQRAVRRLSVRRHLGRRRPRGLGWPRAERRRGRRAARTGGSRAEAHHHVVVARQRRGSGAVVMSTMYPFERFTEDAKRVLTLAQQEAERSRHSYIGTEHLLLALLRQPGVAQNVLSSMGVQEAEVRKAVALVLGRDERILIQQIIPTSRVKRVIEISFEQARLMGSNFVDTGHLLLGLVLEGEGIAARVLEDLGAAADRVVPLVASAQSPRPEPEPSIPGLPPERYRD